VALVALVALVDLVTFSTTGRGSLWGGGSKAGSNTSD